MTNRFRLLILVLACWLPLQSFAAALLHCHALDSALAEIVVSKPAEAGASSDCHGESVSRPEGKHDMLSHQVSPADAPDAKHEPATFCVHCTASCQGIQTLSLERAEQEFAHNPDAFALRSSPAAIDQLPENPQRPPI